MEAQSATRCPGRPRDVGVDARILEHALAQLSEHGFAGMTIDEVARAAGVSKATIYRRYSDKSDLVTAAVVAIKAPSAVDYSGSTRERLARMLEDTRTRMVDRGGLNILRQILAEAQRNPELVELHRERTMVPRIEVVKTILRDGIAAGEVRADLDLDIASDLLAGTWFMHDARGLEFPPDWSERVMDTLWPSFATV